VVDRHPIEAPEPTSADVVWLYEPGPDAGQHSPMRYRPSELLRVIDDVLTDAGIDDVVVTGTVQGVRRRSRWWGFDLVETAPSGESPAGTLRCVVFARHMASIEATLATTDTTLADGAVATVTGTLGVNAPWGELRVVATAISIRNERSAETVAREQLIERLGSSGQAAAQQRLALPVRPYRIAILAGADTAGAADLDALLEGSAHEWQLLRRAVPMAGARAAEAVAAGIATLADRHPEVIVVARGGGAPGEMAWADTATVASAIIRCPVPVWIAIGHATNRSVADLVANRSCATPSAAASALIAMVDEDIHRRRAAAVATAHATALAHAAARTRAAWLTVALVLSVLIAVLVAGVGR
jgi:exodeoxyribonuclease VII large subunit